MEKNKIRRCLSIGASAFIFLVFGIWELVNPEYWARFVPSSLFNFNPTILIIVHGIILTLLGVWLITGKWLRVAAIAGTLVMAQIVLSLIVSSGFSDLVVRDFTIMLFVLSLAFEEK